MFTPSVEVEAVLAPLAPLFTRPSWRRARALLSGVLLAPANCVITSALRVLGLSDDKHFQNYLRVLNRAGWSAHHAAGVLLHLLVQAFVPVGPVVLGLDDTGERRRGVKIRGPLHVPGRRAFELGLLSKDQRSALDRPAPDRAGALGQADVGTALPDGSCPQRQQPTLCAGRPSS